MERQLLKSYENFDLIGVYKNGILLYREADSKPLRSEIENIRIIREFDKSIVVTEEGKIFRSRPGRTKLSDSAVIEIRKMLNNKSISKDSIRKSFCISPNTLKKIERGLVYQHLIDSKEYNVCK